MLKNRPDIDGLRAVAVLSVLLFHAGVPGFGGGFVGVDVFFVISGYLITRIITAEQEAGDFSLLRFYERRARRLLPALFFVAFACVPFAILWMLPHELVEFGHSLMAVVGFVSNILFYFEGGYFESAAEAKPLLHTWSLAIEEQFYLFYPLVLMLLGLAARRYLVAALVLAALLSFGLAEWTSTRMQTLAFYMLPMRGFELLIGALCALVAPLGARVSAAAQQALSSAGLIAIAAAILLYDKDTPFPGVYALLPTLGTALVLGFAASGTWAQRLLSLRPLVGIGLISYSVYLWHQPLFAFARLSQAETPGLETFAALLAVSLVLGALSWKYIEQPFRQKNRISRTRIFQLAALGSVMLFSIGGTLSFYSGFPARFSAADKPLLLSPQERFSYLEDRFHTLSLKEQFSSTATRRIAVIGDSYARDVVNMMDASGHFNDADIITLDIPARCQIYAGSEDISRFIEPRYRGSCARDYAVRLRALASRADVIVLAAWWRPFAAERLGETVQALALKPQQTLYVFGRKSFGSYSLRTFIGQPLAFKAAYRSAAEPELFVINESLRAQLKPEQYIDIQAALCGARARTCPVFTADGALLSHDGGHLTEEGARYAAERVFVERHLKF